MASDVCTQKPTIKRHKNLCRPGRWPNQVETLPVLMTEGEFALLVGKSPKTLARYRREGTGPPHIAVGKTIYYPRDDAIRHFLSSLSDRTVTQVAE